MRRHCRPAGGRCGVARSSAQTLARCRRAGVTLPTRFIAAGQNGRIATACCVSMTADNAPATETVEPNAEDCAEQLRQRFPALFVGAPKPLKLRIQADIRERAPGVFGKAALSAFLRRHTGRTGYLIALSRATHRFDLDGAPADEISAEHRQAALDELARRRDLRASREALLEQQRRNRSELLRAFQGTSLSTANFCALKGVAVDELDGLLELARREAEERAHAAPPRSREHPAGSRRPARRGV